MAGGLRLADRLAILPLHQRILKGAMAMTPTMRPVEGKRYRMRNGSVTPPMKNDGGDQPDHFNGGRWHLDGTYCGVGPVCRDFDLVEALD